MARKLGEKRKHHTSMSFHNDKSTHYHTKSPSNHPSRVGSAFSRKKKNKSRMNSRASNREKAEKKIERIYTNKPIEI